MRLDSALARSHVDVIAELGASQAIPLSRELGAGFYADADRVADAARRQATCNVIHLATMFKADTFVATRDPWVREALQRGRREQLSLDDPRTVSVATPEDVLLHPAARYHPRTMRALEPWQAWVLFFAGGLAAQIAGLVIVIIIASILAARRGALDADGIAAAAASLPALGAALVTTSLILVASALLGLRLARVPIAEGLGMSRPPAAAVAAACLGVVGLGPVSEVLLSIAQRLVPGLTLGTLDSISTAIGGVPLWAGLLLFALMPGFTEELFFRGAFQRAFGRGAKAVVLSGVTFAAYHIDPHHAFAILPVGLFLAWAAARTGNLWVPIAAHVVNNALSIVLTKVNGPVATEPGVIDSPWWLVLFGFALLGAAVAWLLRLTASAPPS